MRDDHAPWHSYGDTATCCTCSLSISALPLWPERSRIRRGVRSTFSKYIICSQPLAVAAVKAHEEDSTVSLERYKPSTSSAGTVRESNDGIVFRHSKHRFCGRRRLSFVVFYCMSDEQHALHEVMDQDTFKQEKVLPALEALPKANVMGTSQARCAKVWERQIQGVDGSITPITRWYCTDAGCKTRADNGPVVAMTCAALDRPGDTLYNKCPAFGERNELWPTGNEPETTISGNEMNSWSWDPPFFPEEKNYYNCFDFYETGPDNREIPRTNPQLYTRSIGIANLKSQTGAKIKRTDVYDDFHSREYGLYTKPDVCTSLTTYDMCRNSSLDDKCLFITGSSTSTPGKCVSVTTVRDPKLLCAYIEGNVSAADGMKKDTCEQYTFCVYDAGSSTCRAAR